MNRNSLSHRGQAAPAVLAHVLAQSRGLFLVALTALSALGLTGCKTSVNTVERAEPTGQKKMISDKRILTDASLSRKVYVVGLNEAMTGGKLLQVQVEVWNQTRSRQRFSYEFQWFDQEGMLVQATTAAVRPVTIEGKETRFFSSVAPSPRCKDFRIKFLEH